MLHKGARNQKPFCIAMLDVDFFKNINDLYGHQKGDEALVLLAEVIRKHFGRANDFIFRIGGEEFVIISDFSQGELFFQQLEVLREEVQLLPIENEGSPFKVMTVSIGALYLSDVSTPDVVKVYADMDRLLYQAKDKGRNRLVICSC